MRNLFFISIFILLPLSLKALPMDFDKILNLGLNVLAVETVNAEEPSCEYVLPPEGSMGKGITNATKVPGSLKIFSPSGEILYNSGDYEKGESGITIKIRGNTSAYADKKPYKIKLQKKADLLLRGDKQFNDKNWVLLNDNNLKLMVGFEVSRLLEEEWTPEGMYVNVVINNDYRGLYYLVESIDRNEKSRINVSDSGFIVEHDAYWWNENGEYLLSQWNPHLNYTFKYPDYKDLSKEDLEKISDILNLYEISFNDDSYSTKIDIESFAKWILGHDILGTWDGGGANLFLSKYDIFDNSKIKAGPLWDFDTIEANEGKWSGVHTALNRFDKFFQSNDTPFMKVYKNLWKNRGKKVYEGIMNLIEDFKDNEKWESYRLSSKATAPIWGSSVDPTAVSLRVESWFISRFDWLRQQLGDFTESEDEAGLHINDKSTNVESFNVYNLQGLRVLTKATKEDIRSLKKGIYIINNKKVIIK